MTFFVDLEKNNFYYNKYRKEIYYVVSEIFLDAGLNIREFCLLTTEKIYPSIRLPRDNSSTGTLSKISSDASHLFIKKAFGEEIDLEHI